MKRSLFALGAAFAFAFALASMAFAAEGGADAPKEKGPAEARETRRPSPLTQLLNRVLREEQVKKCDKNGDGVLDDAEKAELKKAMQEAEKQLLEKYDANKDGKLDEQETVTALSDMIKADYPDLFKKLDADEDGALNKEEIQKGGRVIQQQLREAEILRMFDKNKDGKLDDEEKAAMQKYQEELKKKAEERRKERGDPNADAAR